MTTITLDALCDGDHIAVTFAPPRHDDIAGAIGRARGQVRLIVGQVYLACTSHRSDLGLPVMIRIDDAPPERIELIETDAAAKERRRDASLGERVFSEAPRSRTEAESQLLTLAEMIAAEPRDITADMLGRTRRSQLSAQFDEIADRISLAKAKRSYLLHRGRLGEDFHPWTTDDPLVYKIDTVRPLPSDFHLDPGLRKRRETRLEEARIIFGEAELETRQLASFLRRMGYHVRRPHPNAQELLVRIETGGRVLWDIRLAPSANGLWSAAAAAASNKSQSRARTRLLRDGHLGRLSAMLDDWLEARG